MSSRSTSPTKRALAGTVSPTKRLPGTPTRKTTTPSSDSLNPSLPRLPSLPSLRQKQSPAKPMTASTRAPVRTTPSRVRTQDAVVQQSSSSIFDASVRRGKQPRDSEEPDTSYSLADSDESDDEDAGRPVAFQRSGFGKSRGHATTDDDAGFATARETSIGSVIEHDDEEDEEEDEPQDGKKENVVVCLRVRPLKNGSTDPSIYNLNAKDGILSFAPHHPIAVKRMGMNKGSAPKHDFVFDALHTSPHPTELLYQSRIKPLVRAVMEGFNGTVFAYGQTASGKTHTMMGTPSELGVIPLAIAELFRFIMRQDDRSFSIVVSFLEVYNEVLYDLLAPPSSGKAPSKRLEVTGSEGTVKGLVERPVTLPSEVLDLLREGQDRRTTASTDWNAQSSRSHCVFMVTIESVASNGTARTSRLNLIDLAGSESATTQSERKAEGANINKSLLTLTKVISKLSESNRSAGGHIPYRDSLLTRLLQPALSGKSRVAIICTISPDLENYSESHNTLKFAGDAKKIVTKAERGVLVTDQMMLRQYATQVEQLQAQIIAVEGGDLIKERDSAMAKVDELQTRSRKAEDELVSKDLELERLKSELELTKSFVLTRPVLEANYRRTSGTLPPMAEAWMTPRGKRVASEMSGLGMGSPSARSVLLRTTSITGHGSPMTGTVAKELALEKELQEAQKRLGGLEIKDEEILDLQSRIAALDVALAVARSDLQASQTSKVEVEGLLLATRQELSAELEVVQSEIQHRQRELAVRDQELVTMREEVEGLRTTTSKATTATDTTIVALQDQLAAANDALAVLSSKDAGVVESLKEVESQLASRTAELVAKDATLVAQVASLFRKDAEHLTSINASRSQIDILTADLLAKDTALLSHQERIETTATMLLTRDAQLVDSEAKMEEMLAKSQLPDPRDDIIASLRLDATYHGNQLAEHEAMHAASIQGLQDVLDTRTIERDDALRLVEELRARVMELESALRREKGERDLELESVRSEHVAALASIQSEVSKRDDSLLSARSQIDTLTADTATMSGKMVDLQRSVDNFVRMEREALAYKKDQQVGVKALKSKLDALGSRSTTPTNSTTRTRSGALRLSTEKVEEKVVDYEAQNTTLMARVLELEQRAIEQREEQEKSQRSVEEWKVKLTESQKLVQELSTPRPVPVNKSRQTLSQLNLPVESVHPPVRHGSSGSSGPSPTKARILASFHGASSSYTPGVPPPLPCSPNNIENKRNSRRTTIHRDMAQLNDAKAVQRQMDMIQSPPSSPRKACDEFGGLNGFVARGSSSPGKDENYGRRAKSSTDAGSAWE